MQSQCPQESPKDGEERSAGPALGRSQPSHRRHARPIEFRPFEADDLAYESRKFCFEVKELHDARQGKAGP